MIPMNDNGTIKFDRVFNLWKDGVPKPVHNQKEYNAAAAEGFGDYIPLPYPFRLYNENGVSLDVKSAEEEAAAAADGFQRGRLHVKVAAPAVVAAPAAFVPHNDFSGAIQALEKRSDDQAAVSAALQEDLAAIKAMLESLTAPAKKSKKDSE